MVLGWSLLVCLGFLAVLTAAIVGYWRVKRSVVRLLRQRGPLPWQQFRVLRDTKGAYADFVIDVLYDRGVLVESWAPDLTPPPPNVPGRPRWIPAAASLTVHLADQVIPGGYPVQRS